VAAHGHNIHRIIFILLALMANYLLYCAFSSILGMQPDRAAELAALCAFSLTVVASFAFKRLLEE
jgi:hypothetical protein